MPLILRRACVVTPDHSLRRGDGAIAGKGMRSLITQSDVDVVVHQGIIAAIVPTGTGENVAVTLMKDARKNESTRIFDCEGCVLMPGFVDCHTHACFAGERLSEWEQKLAGVPYLDILKAGGGIHSSVKATREASEADLLLSLQSRVLAMRAHGSTTIEVKTGYGLLADAELRMLRAILGCKLWAEQDDICSIIPTALLGHALEPSMSPADFVQSMCEVALPRAVTMATQTMEQLRAVAMDRGESASTPARRSLLAIDSYIEQGAWSLDQCAQLYRAAHAAGLRTRCHADQFTSQGIVQASIAAAHGDTNTLPAPLHTLDHLEATDAQTLAQLAHTSTIPVLLPCTGFHTDQRFTNARALVDAGGTAALATNYNPGSSPCFAMPMAIALAVRCNKLSIAEALCAATVNAAAALGLQDRGCIWPGQRADLILLHTQDVRSLAYEFGGNPVALAIAGGRGAENHECMKDVRS